MTKKSLDRQREGMKKRARARSMIFHFDRLLFLACVLYCACFRGWASLKRNRTGRGVGVVVPFLDRRQAKVRLTYMR